MWPTRKKKKRPVQDASRQLKAVPFRNERAEVMVDEPGRMVIKVELRYNPVLAKLQPLLGLRSHRNYELEDIGLDVYRRIDSRRTVETLIEDFASEHKLTFFESRGLLLQYMQMLADRGLIAVMLPEKDDIKA